MRHFLYRIDGDRPAVGMISIPDDSLMHRVPEGAVEVGASPVPEDKFGTYFEAWRLGEDGTVSVDMDAAKEIRLNQLRKRREKLLRSLDSRQFRAYCEKKEALMEEIEAEKNALRDFPDNIDWDAVSELRQIQHVLPPELV